MQTELFRVCFQAHETFIEALSDGKYKFIELRFPAA